METGKKKKLEIGVSILINNDTASIMTENSTKDVGLEGN